MGLVPRDLKPVNIMLTPSGVKLLDFGLGAVSARWSLTRNRERCVDGPRDAPGDCSDMSPEQIEGREADARSDLFSFGAVLYEMIAGRRAFTGKHAGQLDRRNPQGRSTFPSRGAADSAVRSRSIDTKLPGEESGGSVAERPRSALRARLDCRSPAACRRSITPCAVRRDCGWRSPSSVRLQQRCCSTGSCSELHSNGPRSGSMLPPPEGSQFISVGTHAGPAVLSPDGRRVASWRTSTDGRLRLWIRSLDSLVTRSLSGTEGASYPFWSADGDQLGFFADRN